MSSAMNKKRIGETGSTESSVAWRAVALLAMDYYFGQSHKHESIQKFNFIGRENGYLQIPG